MASFNKVIIVGNLTRDPELKQLASGNSVCRLGLASNRQSKGQGGTAQQEVCFVDVDVWGPQAEACQKYLAKGRAVLVEGRLKYDTWKDAEGQTRSKHSIVANVVQFLSMGGDQATGSAGAMGGDNFADEEPTPAPKAANASRGTSKKLAEQPFEDDLPF
jgi:single-strand DNA-binding protein